MWVSPTAGILPPRCGLIGCFSPPWVALRSTHGWDPATAMRFHNVKKRRRDNVVMAAFSCLQEAI